MSFATTLFKKPILVLLACMIPAICINSINKHNWGDDFAQYLMHSQKLASFQNPCKINYVYNPEYPVMSPAVYPLGFPLLLAPVSAFGPSGLLPFKLFMQLFYIGFILASFFLIHKHFNAIAATILCLVLAYNPYLLEFKGQILSDIPFALFFMLSCYHIEKGTSAWKTSLLVAFTIFIRTVGITLFAAWVFKLLVDYYQKRGLRFPTINLQFTINSIAVFFLPVLVFYLNQKSAGAAYSNQMAQGTLIETVKTNLSLQVTLMNNLYIPDIMSFGGYQFTWIIFPLLLFTGLINHILKKGYFLVLVFVLYEGLILIFPYQYATFRFSIPLLPFLLLFLIDAFEFIAKFIPQKTLRTGVCICLLGFTCYTFAVKNIELQKNLTLVTSPEDKEATEMFHFVKTKTPKEARFIFTKPKALGYFGQRKCIANNPANNNIPQLIQGYACGYLITSKLLENKGLDDFTQKVKYLDLVFSNTYFRVYRVRPALQL
jgi:hypothetical protein